MISFPYENQRWGDVGVPPPWPSARVALFGQGSVVHNFRGGAETEEVAYTRLGMYTPPLF